MCTGDKRQAYLCHKADHLQFAQKTDGTALVQGTREPCSQEAAHKPLKPREVSICPAPLLQHAYDLSGGALLSPEPCSN